MEKYNSSELAAQVAAKLGYQKDQELMLYRGLSQVPNGVVKDALAALAKPEEKPRNNKYIAVFRGSQVRDAQYATHEDADPLDDDAWLDAEDMPLYIGIVEAESDVRARQLVAVRERVDVSVIDVFNIDGTRVLEV